MLSPCTQFLDATKATVVERFELEPRPERLRSCPEEFRSGPMSGWIKAMTGRDDMLWNHQSLALEAYARGENVVVATGTASGKSLIFQAAMMRELLAGTGRVMLLFPQKALGNDQQMRTERALELAGLDADLAGVIHGDVAMSERDRVLSECRVVLATPDVIHSWLMRQVASPVVLAFLADLRLLVIDEAHVLEGVFGSNGAYLFRRLRAAHERFSRPGDQLRFIAATATIIEPEQHMLRLTGCTFTAITEQENGAPFHGLTLLHLEGPAFGAASERLAADLGIALADVVHPDAFIVFNDSRQGVERITRAINHPSVLPYRGGYESRDRVAIETKLHRNEARGIISTSALELGIDIPQFTIGLNIGVPQTRKAFRQRVGRIGRNAPGLFAIVAPPSAFSQLGSSFREFYEGQVERSHLYLTNRFIQFQQARCLLDEASCDNGTVQVDGHWPEGFGEMLAAAEPGASRPRDLDHLAALGSDSPHLAYPLRDICEVSYALRSIRNPSEIIGKIELDKALREAYPGATYFHLGKAHRVTEWRSNSYEHSIMLEPLKGAQPTQPLLRTAANVSTNDGELIDGRLLQGDRGILAEVSLRVTDSVEGYRIGSTAFPYRELRTANRRMIRRYREFATTGVLLRVQESWFAGSGDAAVKTRQVVSEALVAVLAREHNIAPAELRFAYQNIAQCGSGAARPIDDAIVIFDGVAGGLRLSAPLYDDLLAILDRLQKAAELAGEEALLAAPTVELLRDWRGSLQPGRGSEETSPVLDDGDVIIFAPQSEVAVRIKGALMERTLLEPQFVCVGDDQVLMYRYEAAPNVHSWVAHDQVQAIGSNWQHAIWNPVSNEIREIAA
jgi:DEAD/DEAH box helicase domain-containing protein